MPYNATIIQVLLSSPSDLPEAHRENIQQTIRQWNINYSKTFSVLFNITDWKIGAAPNTGLDAQGLINEQIVDESDAAIVVLTDRLGTPTSAGYPSGTAEEIDRMLKAGKLVSVLLNDENRPPLHGDALAERQKLEAYIKELQTRALTKEYGSIPELTNVINGILAYWARRYKTELDNGMNQSPEFSDTSREQVDSSLPQEIIKESSIPFDEQRGIWPHIETTEHPRTDSKGRLRVSRKHKIVLQSTLPYQAKDVVYRFEDKDGNPSNFSLRDPEGNFDVTPNGSISFPISTAWGTADKAYCVVTWKDPSAHDHSTKSFVKL